MKTRKLSFEILPMRAMLSGTSWYVSTAGNNANAGTSSAPFATIQQALNHAHSGDTVLIAGGTYRDSGNTNLTLSTSGVTIEAVSGQQVTIDGATVISTSAWTLYSGSIYVDSSWGHYIPPTASGTGDARSLPGDQLYVDGQFLTEATTLSSLPAGQFYINPSTKALYLRTSASDSPAKHSVAGTTATSMISLGATSNVTIANITFIHCANTTQPGAIDSNGGSNVVVQNCTCSYADASAFSFQKGSNDSISGSIAMNNGQEGIHASFTNGLQITNCQTAYNNQFPGKGYQIQWEAGGAKLADVTNTVVNGLVSHDNSGPGLWFDLASSNNTIENCALGRNLTYGLLYEISYTATIINNVAYGSQFSETNLNAPDAIGIYLSSSAGCLVENNTTSDNGNCGIVSAGPIRADGSGHYVYAYANTIKYNIDALNQTVHQYAEMRATDYNSGSVTSTSGYSSSSFVVPYSYTKFSNNEYYGSYYSASQAGFFGSISFQAWQSMGMDSGSIFQNPKFGNYAKNNFESTTGPGANYNSLPAWYVDLILAGNG